MELVAKQTKVWNPKEEQQHQSILIPIQGPIQTPNKARTNWKWIRKTAKVPKDAQNQNLHTKVKIGNHPW